MIVRLDSRPELYVLTNHHVIAGAKEGDTSITLHDGRVLRPAGLE